MSARRARGFTLLEVVAAIAILALSATVLLKALGASMALTHKAATQTQAAAWAQSMLDSAFTLTPPVPGMTRGRFDATYRWQLTVTPWQLPAPQTARRAQPVATPAASRLQLYQLDLAVTWGPAARQHVLRFDTLRVARVHAAQATP